MRAAALKKKTFEELLYYDKHDDILTLYKRDSRIKDYIKVIDDRSYDVKYKPEELHFGSATVGGVTTGGVYKTGGYNYISGSHINEGVAQLCVDFVDHSVNNGFGKGEHHYGFIKAIKLSDDLFSQAQKSEMVKDYLDEREKQIVVYGRNKHSMLDIATKSLDELRLKNAPPKTKCENIMRWMTG